MTDKQTEHRDTPETTGDGGRFVFREVFKDITPNAIVQQRLVLGLMTQLPHTSLNDQQRKVLHHRIIGVALKLCLTHRHLTAYGEKEDALILAANSAPIEPGTRVVREILNAQELLFELDGFLTQLKSTLDYAVKFPEPILGRKLWSLHTFSDKGEGVSRILRQNTPKALRARAKFLADQLDQHRGWLEQAISARDRANHAIGGGLDLEMFAVAVERASDGSTRVHRPMWTAQDTIREVMNNLWENLFTYVEHFCGAFLFYFGLPDGWAVAYSHQDMGLNPPRSPWRIFNPVAAQEMRRQIQEDNQADLLT